MKGYEPKMRWETSKEIVLTVSVWGCGLGLDSGVWVLGFGFGCGFEGSGSRLRVLGLASYPISHSVSDPVAISNSDPVKISLSVSGPVTISNTVSIASTNQKNVLHLIDAAKNFLDKIPSFT